MQARAFFYLPIIIYNKMISYLINISERCYNAAEKRGINTCAMYCMVAIGNELQEYWAAMDNGKTIITDNIGNLLNDIQGADDGRFVALYDKYIHHTDYDEMADMIIIAATWIHSTKLFIEHRDGPGAFNPYRSSNAMLASGVLQFMTSQMITTEQIRVLRCVINLKMRYNELRED